MFKKNIILYIYLLYSWYGMGGLYLRVRVFKCVFLSLVDYNCILIVSICHDKRHVL